MHAAALVSFAALAFKDQLTLRGTLLLSILISFAYHMSNLSGPAWQEMMWDAVHFAITTAVLIQLIFDRTHIGLTSDEEALYQEMNSLTPGEFRALLKVGAWKTAETETEITAEGVRPDHLFYVFSGEILIAKGDRQIKIEPKTFIGEVAFLHKTPASATVSLAPGARYIEWPVSQLQQTMGARHSLRHSITQLIGLDMALKIARS
jgi:CRP-like cAMP-binding protein